MSFTTRIKVFGKNKRKKDLSNMTQLAPMKAASLSPKVIAQSRTTIENSPTPEKYVEIDGIKFKITESEEEKEEDDGDGEGDGDGDASVDGVEQNENDAISSSSSSNDLPLKTKKRKTNQDAVKKKTQQPKSKNKEPQQQEKQREKPKDDAAMLKINKRKVFLSKFSINTPLYPVCRAWMANEQESKYIDMDYLFLQYVKRPQNGLKMLKALIEDDISCISLMPAPMPAEKSALTSRIPNADILCYPKFDESNKNALDNLVKRLESKDIDDCPSTVGLLREHLIRWKRIKENWTKHIRAYDGDRYGVNSAILSTIFKRN